MVHADVPSPEKLVPEDTLVLYTIPDFNQMRGIYAGSPHGQFWNDPAMHDFKEKFLTKLSSDFIGPMEHELGVKLADYMDLPQGQVTFALSQNGWQGKEDQSVAYLVIIDTKGKSDKLKSSLADLLKKWVDAGNTIKTEKIRDRDFSLVTFSKEALAKALQKSAGTNAAPPVEKFENPETKKHDKKSFYIGQADSLLIMGESSQVIEKVLVRLQGGEVKPLAENPLFSADEPSLHDAQTYVWINTHTLMDVMLKNLDDSSDSDNKSPLKMNPKKVMSGLGLNTLNTISLSYNYTPDGAYGNLFIGVPASSRAGLFKILEGEQKEIAIPAFVPADAVKFQRWRLDGSKTWENIRQIASSISPTSVNTIDFVIGSAESAAREKDPSFDLKKNLFGNLGDDIITYQKNPKGQSLADLSAPPTIYLIGSPAPERLMSAIRGLIPLMPAQDGAPKDRDFLGHKIYSLPLPPSPGSDTARSLTYTTSSTYFVIATDSALVEEYLRSADTPPKPLKETSGLSDAQAQVTSKETTLFGFSNESENMKFLFDLLKKNSADSDPLASLAPLTMAMGMTDGNLKDWVDISLLPTYDKIAKYFSFSVYSFGANSHGFTFKGFSPTPPAFKK